MAFLSILSLLSALRLQATAMVRGAMEEMRRPFLHICMHELNYLC